jgi:hypothetical protein
LSLRVRRHSLTQIWDAITIKSVREGRGVATARRVAWTGRNSATATLHVRHGSTLFCSHSQLVRSALLLALPLALLFGLDLGLRPNNVWAYSPQSAEVRQVIDKALTYLATAREKRLGGKCLIGLVFLKERQPEHPKVKEALEAVRSFVDQSPERLVVSTESYTPSLAIMFLCELDPGLYHDDIQKLLRAMWQRQLPQGAWTYGSGQQGDTSQTQYGVLACWTAHRAGFDVPSSAVLNVCQWLVRTQDPGGGFGYKPHDPGSDNPHRVDQKEIRESVSIAGLGSLYICSTLLGLNPLVQRASGDVQVVPSALVPVPERGSGSLDVRLNRSLANRIRRAMNDGNRWQKKNYTISPDQYTYYYLYALERYQSFREIAEGNSMAEPHWYNEGVEFLAREQTAEGSWPRPQGFTGTAIDACFAVLFLQRNTKKTINRNQFGEGLLIGGRGLPTDTRRIRVVDGRVVSALERRSAAALARVLSDPDSPDFEALARAGDALLIDPTGTTAEDQASLRRLADSQNLDVRVLAIRALATQRNLDNVPTFITALADEDSTVVRTARDALRQVSRKFEGFELPDHSTVAQRESVIRAWQTWYLGIRPEAEFGD